MPHQGRRHADDALLLTLACGASIEAAAAKVGVSPATVHRRLQNPEFRKRLQAIRGDLFQRAAAMMTAAAGEAVKTLLALLQASIPPAARLGAARAILELGVRLRQTAELEERLQALEERLAGDEGSAR